MIKNFICWFYGHKMWLKRVDNIDKTRFYPYEIVEYKMERQDACLRCGAMID